MMRYPSIHEQFSRIAATFPQHTAVADAKRHLSYRELEQRSDVIAHFLTGLGIGAGAKVGVFASRSIEAVAAFLGILKAGAAYVPFDAAYPAALLRYVYEDCRPSAMLVEPPLLSARGIEPFWEGQSHDIRAVFEGPPLKSAPQLPAVHSSDLAYVMFTSGSTGHPKGVLVPHRGVVRLVVDTDFVQLGPQQVHLQLAPLAFDASTFEIWGALLNGGKLGILPAPYPSLDEIAQHIERYGVTTLWLTAGLFHLMVEQRLTGLAPLRQLIAGGDILSPPHVAKVLHQLPNCQLINGYGPTENTTFTCCFRVPADMPLGPIPIGTPISGTSVYILDSDAQPVPDGEVGELFAGGAGVALGYLNRNELTNERFLIDPWNDEAGMLMYRTGDRVRRHSNGQIEFLGRADRQVKINGKRVELDEIEATLRRSPAIEDAAVTSPPVQTESRKINAYVIWKADRTPVLDDLKAFLKLEMPDYMQPSSITPMDTFPLSATGKVDRSKLPAPESAVGVSPNSVNGVAADAMEVALLRIWRDILGTQAVGLNDNFFDLGGTSLQLIAVHATIVSVMSSDVTVVELFQFPRISALAHHLAERSANNASSMEAAKTSGTMLSLDERARRQQATLARARGHSRRNTQ